MFLMRWVNFEKLKFPGIAVIINNDFRVVGVVTDGDIRRAFAEKNHLIHQLVKLWKKNQSHF